MSHSIFILVLSTRFPVKGNRGTKYHLGGLRD